MTEAAALWEKIRDPSCGWDAERLAAVERLSEVIRSEVATEGRTAPGEPASVGD